MSHSTNSRESCECKENLRLLSLVVLTALLALSVGAFGQTQGPAVRLKASNGQYVVAEGGGGGVVNANRPQAGAWETFTLIDKNGGILMNGDAVNFKTATGHFLVAEGSGGREVLANRTAPGPWETFVMVKVKGSAGQEIVHGDAIALRASSGQYLVAEGGGGGVVNANRNAIGPWETFILEFVGGAAPQPTPPSVTAPAPVQAAPTIGPAKPPVRPRFPAAPGPTPAPAPAPQQPGIQLPGKQPPTAVQAVEAETRPPGPAPTNVSATAEGPTTVKLEWWSVPQAVGYLVERDGVLVTQSPVTSLGYIDSGAAPKKTYRYTVAAAYPQGGQYAPGWSAPVSVTTPPILPPADLKATPTGTNTIVLSWSPRPGAYGYVLLRNGTRIGPATGPITSTTYSDQVPGPGVYWYQVAAAYQGIGVGERSSTVTANTPIWGFADTHTHQFANLGFGGLLMWGRPFGPIDQALPWCTPAHGLAGTGDKIGNFMQQGLLAGVSAVLTGGLIAGGHNVGGYLQYDGWPRWDSYTHQQMHEGWLRRAHWGGLRLVVVHAVNSELFCNVSNHPLSCNDMEAVDRQLAAAKEMERYIDQQSGGPGKGWYRIVRSPREAREAIYNGQLAVVLGIEVQSLFNCRANGTCTKQYVSDQLQKYYDQGVRHTHPIHNADNGFGGAAVYMSEFNFNNKYLNGYFFGVEDCTSQGVSFRFQGDALGWALSNAIGLPGMVSGSPPAYPDVGQCNSRPLTELGESLIRDMMRKHMIIDIDHMSSKVINRVFEIAQEQNQYPLIAGHTGFIETSFGQKRHESQKNGGQLNKIRAFGGLVSVITNQGKTDEILAYGGKVRNDCSSSTKTWAQAYLYAVAMMGGPAQAAVALATDANGFAGQPGPRFGNQGCHGNSTERDAQKNTPGVSYPFTLPGMTQPMPMDGLGQRRFDFNTDGLAHVGMLPDFIQDLRLLLRNDDDLKPLFRSAEGYIRMWEKAEGGTAAATMPPLFVKLEYGPRTPTGGTVTVFAADWKTGAGVQGRVKLDGLDKGAIGAPITYQYMVGPTGQVDLEGNPVLDSSGQPVTGPLPIAGLVTAVNYLNVSYPNVSFEIPPPRLDLKLVPGRPTSTNRTITVTAVDVESRTPVTTGTVTINGKTGQLGQPITYPSCGKEVQTEVIETTTGKKKVVTTKTPLPCSGLVQAPGYEPAPFTDIGS